MDALFLFLLVVVFVVFLVFLVYLLDQHWILVVVAVLRDLSHAIHADVTSAHKGVAI